MPIVGADYKRVETYVEHHLQATLRICTGKSQCDQSTASPILVQILIRRPQVADFASRCQRHDKNYRFLIYSLVTGKEIAKLTCSRTSSASSTQGLFHG
ncbi:hypothetical protein VUR80DRAFT_1228 [Thermomyces stellatus]